jgi:hypothetical protein
MIFLRSAYALPVSSALPAPTWPVAGPAPAGDSRRPRDRRPAPAEKVPLDETVCL